MYSCRDSCNNLHLPLWISKSTHLILSVFINLTSIDILMSENATVDASSFFQVFLLACYVPQTKCTDYANVKYQLRKKNIEEVSSLMIC